MNEKQTNLLEFELKMAQVPLANWTESDIRSWLTLRERANEDRRLNISYDVDATIVAWNERK